MEQKGTVELVPDGIGARQLHSFYQELDLSEMGSLLIEPLKTNDAVLGVLLVANQSDMNTWSERDKALTIAVASYIAQAVANSQRFEMLVAEQPVDNTAEKEQLLNEIHFLEEERDEALAKVKSLTGMLRETEVRLAQENERALKLAAGATLIEKRSNNENMEVLKKELNDLQTALDQAETNLNMIVTGAAGIDPDWVVKTISSYSAELEKASERINQLQLESSKLEPIFKEVEDPAHSLVVNKTNPDVRQIIEAVVNNLSHKLSEKSLKLDLDLDQKLPLLSPDDDSFFHIITRLLNNACQVSIEGSRLIISAHQDFWSEDAEDGQAGFLHLFITDSGGNKSQVIHTSVLESRRQSGKENAKGRLNEEGRNLAEALELIEASGGRTWVKVENSSGSTLSVLLPIQVNTSVNRN
jgi:signal transduction histidine kinase